MSDAGEVDMTALLAKMAHDYQIYYLAAIWLESVVYGLYLCLFMAAIHIMTRKRGLDHFASRVFLFGILVMFVLITIHTAVNVYKLMQAYAFVVPPMTAGYYFIDFLKWDNFAHPVILAILTWTGDCLVIYRCFLIWRRSIKVIIAPIILLIASIGTTSVNLYWFQHGDAIPWPVMNRLLKVTYPLNLLQNILTTGLIAYKVYSQHRATRASGLLLLSANLDLLTIMRIVVESALIYTVQMFIMIFLFYTNHPSLALLQHMMAPSMGIVFVLIAIRTHVARSDSVVRNAYPSNNMYPSWMSMENSDPRRGHNMPIVTTVTEQHHLDVMTPNMKMETEHANSYRSSDGTIHKTIVPDMKV